MLGQWSMPVRGSGWGWHCSGPLAPEYLYDLEIVVGLVCPFYCTLSGPGRPVPLSRLHYSYRACCPFGSSREAAAMAPLITVLTVTRRIEALDRCIDSIQEQTYDGPIVHRFVVDGNDEIVTHLTNRALSSRIPILWTFMSRGFGDTDGPARLAVLRNAAVKLAGSDYVAFLDDDNRWEPIHLQSLWSTIVAESVDIAHTERKLFHHDGSPYLIPEFPWCRDEVSRRAIYTYCLEAGIMERGSNVVHDRFEMRFTWVDLGEWLFRRDFLLANPFETRYSSRNGTTNPPKLASSQVTGSIMPPNG